MHCNKKGILGMFGIKAKLSLLKTKWLWRRGNEANGTYPVSPIADLSNIQIGRFSYGPIDLHSSSKAPHLKIGICCSIASNVVFVTHDDHPTRSFSSFPFRVMALGDVAPEAIGKGGIVLEDDVWIGYRATILDGVTIHRGGVVAAGAVVCKDVPPYTIVGGVPAKPIKKRFDDETISRLMAFDYSKVDETWIQEHLRDLYSPIDERVLKRLLNEPGSVDEF